MKRLSVDLHAILAESGTVQEMHDKCIECTIYLRGCENVQKNIQCLMDQGLLQLRYATKNEEVSTIEPCSCWNKISV